MRLKKELVEHISKKIVESLIKKEMLVWDDRPEKLEAIVTNIIIEDLMVEDRLNDEVKMLLESKTKDYERNMMDFGRAFHMVKSRLVKERGLIL